MSDAIPDFFLFWRGGQFDFGFGFARQTGVGGGGAGLALRLRLWLRPPPPHGRPGPHAREGFYQPTNHPPNQPSNQPTKPLHLHFDFDITPLGSRAQAWGNSYQPTDLVRGLLGTNPPDPTLESASPSPPWGSM